MNIKTLLTESPERILILDGGMGTVVEDRGIDIQNPLWGSYALLSPEGRNINNRIHAEYVEAGADVITANTHNLFVSACGKFIEKHGNELPRLGFLLEQAALAEQPSLLHKHLLQTSVDSARSAIPSGNQVLLATCIGSVDAPYATESSVAVEEVAAVLEIEIKARQALDAELILIETLTTIDEIKGAALALERCKPVTVGIGLTCGSDGRTLGGVAVLKACEILTPANPAACFIQCTRFDLVETALDELISTVDSDVIPGVYANDGRGWDHIKMEWTGERITPDEYAAQALKWKEMGARIIGGCCGTGPEHIRKLKEVLG